MLGALLARDLSAMLETYMLKARKALKHDNALVHAEGPVRCTNVGTDA